MAWGRISREKGWSGWPGGVFLKKKAGQPCQPGQPGLPGQPGKLLGPVASVQPAKANQSKPAKSDKQLRVGERAPSSQRRGLPGNSG